MHNGNGNQNAKKKHPLDKRVAFRISKGLYKKLGKFPSMRNREILEEYFKESK